MASERWKRISELFEAAVELPADAQVPFLRESCRGDDRMRAEVEKLLATDRDPRTILDREGAASQFAPELGADLVGATIGAFRLQRVIGRGGMGTVYAATQERPNRIVALKTLSLGLASPSSRRRFEYESEILARLRHPGVAQVFDAGTFDLHGRQHPYFAMEMVEGARTLDAHVRESGLGVVEIIDLVERVCEAVNYSHQNGVIHRDLKPANILVDGGGQPKIIDFGIARDTDAELSIATQPPSGRVAGSEGDNRDQQPDRRKHGRVARPHFVQQTAQEAGQSERADQPDRNT